MPRYYLRTLSIEGFRGINNQGHPFVLKFDQSKVTSVFGENGMGKSSVFEALEYAIFGRVNRLADMQQIENSDRYYLNQFHPGPARIILEFEPDDAGVPVIITVERTKNGARKVTGQNLTDCHAFLNTVQAETLLMDYRTFNKFVMEKPLERGRFLSRLLGLERVSAVRAALSSLRDTKNLNNDLDVNALRVKVQAAKASRRHAAISALNQVSDIRPHTFSADAFDLRKVADYCLATLNEDPVISPLITGKTLSQIDYKACLERLQDSDRSGQRQKLAALHVKKGRLTTPIDLLGLEMKMETLQLKVRKRQELVDDSKGEAYKALYQAAQQVLSVNPQAEECPLCERLWEHKSGLNFPHFVAHQLENYREILELDDSIKTVWKSLIQDDTVSKLVTELEQRAPEAAPAALGTVDLPTEKDVSSLRNTFVDLEEHRCRALATIQREIAEVEATVPPSLAASIQAVTASKNLTDSLKAYLAAETEEKVASDELAAINQWEAFIDKAASDFAQEETVLVRATIAMLEQNIRALYMAIMPGAPVLPKLSRQEGSEKLLLMLEHFYGVKDAHAVPLLSESYRNALGLAVFLAASQKRTHGGRFLVLDDVTSSFDAGHQSYLLEAIYQHVAKPENPNGLQVIILSHDGTLKKYFDMATSSGKAWTNHRLQGTAPTGSVTAKAIPVDELRNDILNPLSTGDLTPARRAVRPYLEATLLEIVDQVHIRVPLDMATIDHKRMLRDLMEAIKWEIRLRQLANELVLDSAAVKDITQNIIPFLQANPWAHYATDSTTSVDANAIRGVADAIDRLVDAFKYTCNCGPGKPERKFYRSLGEKPKGCGPKCK